MRLPAGLLLLALPALASAQVAGAIAGAVRDSAGVPVAAAEVTIAGSPLRATTDASGRFRFASVPTGQQVVSARRIGFRRRDASIIVEAGREATAPLVLERLVQQLDAVLVEAARGRRAGHLAGFYERKRIGAGRFITQERLEQRESSSLPEVLSSELPGVRIVSTRWVSQGIRLRSQSCAPLVWIDGTPAPAAEFDLSAIPTMSVAAVEVYSGPATVPGEFQLPQGAHACGVIAVWSRMWDGSPRARRRKPPSLDSAVAELKVYDATEVDQPARVDTARLRAPAYPDSLYAYGVSGEAVLEFIVEPSGEVREGSVGVVSTTHPAFGAAAVRALLASRFEAARHRGRPVPQLVLLPFRFQLTSESRR